MGAALRHLLRWPKASAAEGAITAAYDRLRADRGEEVTEQPALDPSDANLGLVDWDERLDAGRETFLEVNGLPAPITNTPYRNSGIVGFVFGHLWRRPALDHRERRFITVPCVMVEGARIPMLNHVGSALESGQIKKPEMDEVIQTIAAYSGLELAPERIRVNTIHPTAVNSGMTDDPTMKMIIDMASAGGKTAISGMENALPIDMLEPEDIANAVAFLVSDEAHYITGVNLALDAGFALSPDCNA